MKAYSIDLRKRVLAAYDSGRYRLSRIAEQFQVTTRWIQKLRQQRTQDGSIAPRPQNQGRKPAFRDKQLQELDDFVKKHSDATLEEIREYFAGSVNCSIVAIHNTLKPAFWRAAGLAAFEPRGLVFDGRLGWRYKKTVTSRRARQRRCKIAAVLVEKSPTFNES